MIKAVIFDLDGTLVDSLGDLCDSTNFALQKYGFPTHEKEKFNYFVGDGMLKLIERAIPKERFNTEVQQKVYLEFLAHYREHFLDKTSPYDYIPQTISELKEKGIKLAVVSNKNDEMVRKIADKFFKGSFQLAFGKREGYPLKPDPTSTLAIIKELGVSPKECAFVGDSGMDMLTAKNTGCVAVGALWGFRTREELVENGSDYLLENPSEISPLILGLK